MFIVILKHSILSLLIVSLSMLFHSSSHSVALVLHKSLIVIQFVCIVMGSGMNICNTGVQTILIPINWHVTL